MSHSDSSILDVVRTRRGAAAPRIIGRYALHEEIACGGMATVHLGRLLGSRGFTRTVAIKRLHAQFAKDPDFSAMFLDEARLAARVRHPNVVPMLDVVAGEGEIFLVMEYVHGESLAFLLRACEERGKRLPTRLVCNIIAGALHGLHAAHEATGEGGVPLGLVHRDVSPQNVLVGVDGVARVLDFGVAKAIGKVHTTREGQIKGKLRYMAPEQVLGGEIGPRCDLWAASVMLWEALTGERLFAADNDVALLRQVLDKPIPSPRTVRRDIPVELSDLVMRGLRRNPADRIASAQEYATTLERIVGLAAAHEVGQWVRAAARDELAARARRVADVESIVSVPTTAPVGKTIPPIGERAPAQRGRAVRNVLAMGLLAAAVTGLFLSHRAIPVGAVQRAPALAAEAPVANEAAVAPPLDAASAAPPDARSAVSPDAATSNHAASVSQPRAPSAPRAGSRHAPAPRAPAVPSPATDGAPRATAAPAAPAASAPLYSRD